MVVLSAASASPSAQLSLAEPNTSSTHLVATIDSGTYGRVTRWAGGYAATGKNGINLFDSQLNPAGVINVAGAGNATGETVSPDGKRTAIAINTGNGRQPDSNTIVSLSTDTATTFSVKTQAFPALLSQCNDGTLLWLERAGSTPPAGVDNDVAMDLVVAKSPEQIKRVHLPTIAFPQIGAIDCGSHAVTYLAAASGDNAGHGGSTIVTVTDPGPHAMIHQQPVDGVYSTRDATGGIRTTQVFVGRDRAIHSMGPDGVLDSWWFGDGTARHTAVATTAGGPGFLGVTFSGDTAVVRSSSDRPASPGTGAAADSAGPGTSSSAAPTDSSSRIADSDTPAAPGALAVRSIVMSRPECVSSPATIPVDGDPRDVIAVLPAVAPEIDCPSAPPARTASATPVASISRTHAPATH